jgi:ribosomal protein S18 acetylase RimI-like enzyme
MEVQFRKATPKDADAAIPLIYSSGPAAFDYVLAHRTRIDSQEFLHRAFIQGGSEFGYENHDIGVSDGKVVAIGTGFNGEERNNFTLATLKMLFQANGLLGGIGVIRRGLKVDQHLPEPAQDEHYIGHIGVTPDLRGHGIGGQLMNYLVEQGRERGRRIASLDVSYENPRAQILYERLGFEVKRELVSTLRNSTSYVPNHRRMELVL